MDYPKTRLFQRAYSEAYFLENLADEMVSKDNIRQLHEIAGTLRVLAELREAGLPESLRYDMGVPSTD